MGCTESTQSTAVLAEEEEDGGHHKVEPSSSYKQVRGRLRVQSKPSSDDSPSTRTSAGSAQGTSPGSSSGSSSESIVTEPVQPGASETAQAERGHQRSVEFDLDSTSTISSSTLSSLQSGKTILGRFAFADGDNIRLGEGTSSVCYLGSNIETGEAVAIKVYKRRGGIGSTLAKFRRHVRVLQEVQQPFVVPADDALWCDEIARTDPTDFFLRLLDFSKDAGGEPAQDLADGRMYIVTELADCTLKKMLRERSQRNAPLSAEAVRKIAAEVLLAVAWLHSKGYVHLDVRPENIMLCGGRWKLIDMDGCVRAGTEVKLNNSVSVLPRYCAPDIVCSVIKGGNVTVKPSMDAWSVGNTIAELVRMCPLLWAQYQEISDGQSHHGGSVCFLRKLGVVQAAWLPRPGESRFKILLCTWLIMPNPEGLRTLAQSLNAPHFQRRDLE